MVQIKEYTDIDLSLKKSFTGDVRKKTNIDAINQHLKLLLLTEQDDIPFLNNISADIRNLLFEQYSLHIENTLNELIRNIITQHEKRITIIEISNTFDSHEISINISYKIKSDNTVGQFKTILKKTR